MVVKIQVRDCSKPAVSGAGHECALLHSERYCEGSLPVAASTVVAPRRRMACAIIAASLRTFGNSYETLNAPLSAGPGTRYRRCHAGSLLAWQGHAHIT